MEFLEYRRTTLDEWDAVWSRECDPAWELFPADRVLMTPDSREERFAAGRLAQLFDEALGDGAYADIRPQLQLSDDPPTVLRPDVAVLAKGAPPLGRVMAADALLVAEVISAYTRHRDWYRKSALYAATGIPNYAIVDVTDTGPMVALFTSPSGGMYAEPSVADLSDFTADIGGESITIRVEELLVDARAPIREVTWENPPGTPVLPRLYGIEDWDRYWSDPKERYELIAGIPVKKPPRTPEEERAIAKLTEILEQALDKRDCQDGE